MFGELLVAVWTASTGACVIGTRFFVRGTQEPWFVSFVLSFGAVIPGILLAEELGLRLALAEVSGLRAKPPYEYWTTLWSAFWILAGPVLFVAAFLAREGPPSRIRRAQRIHVALMAVIVPDDALVPGRSVTKPCDKGLDR